MNSHDFKALSTRKSKLEAKKSSMIIELNRQKKSISDIDASIDEINERIKCVNIEPSVSEHAVLRYLERIKQIDINKVEPIILDEKTKQTIETIGSGRIPREDCTLIIKDKRVITLYDPEDKRGKRGS